MNEACAGAQGYAIRAAYTLHLTPAAQRGKMAE
jgi:hypothetical protein